MCDPYAGFLFLVDILKSKSKMLFLLSFCCKDWCVYSCISLCLFCDFIQFCCGCATIDIGICKHVAGVGEFLGVLLEFLLTFYENSLDRNNLNTAAMKSKQH